MTGWIAAETLPKILPKKDDLVGIGLEGADGVGGLFTGVRVVVDFADGAGAEEGA